MALMILGAEAHLGLFDMYVRSLVPLCSFHPCTDAQRLWLSVCQPSSQVSCAVLVEANSGLVLQANEVLSRCLEGVGS